MSVVYLGLGSNLEPEPNLQLASRELRRRFSLNRMSAVYRSAAMGFDGADFLNAVACIDTELTPQELHAELELIHDAADRQRNIGKIISRTLDIDLLLFDRLVLDDPPLRIPREDVLQYSFVLRPLSEIAPDYRHPVSGRTLGDHWREFDAASHPLTPVDLNL